MTTRIAACPGVHLVPCSSGVVSDAEPSSNFRLQSHGQVSTFFIQLPRALLPLRNRQPRVQGGHLAQPGKEGGNQGVTQAQCPP